jgi:hypothetical protein
MHNDPDSLTEAASAIQDALAHRRDERASLARRLERVDEEILSLDVALRNVQLVGRTGAVLQFPRALGSRGREDLTVEETPRTDLIMQILRVSGRPLNRKQVLAELERLGRSRESADDVSAALAYLNRKGRITRGPAHTWQIAHDAVG